MKKVYIVFGETGEYSDHQYWEVCAYEEQCHAEAHAAALNKQFARSSRWSWEKRRAFKTNLDADCECDYTGTIYEVQEVDVYSSFEEYLASNPPTESALDDDELTEAP